MSIDPIKILESPELMKSLMDAAMSEVFGDTAQARKNYGISANISNATEKAAKMAKTLYDAYVKVGFTEEQAFELIKNINSPKM